MRRLLGPIGVIIAMAGVVAMLWPLTSVWRLSGQALAELPAVPAAASTETDRNRLGLLDGDFLLGTRTYRGASAEDVRAALLGSGFERTAIGGEAWLAKPCCGDYDAVLVRVDDGPDGALAVVTAADADIQVSWPVLSSLGIPVVLGGLAIARRSRPGRPPVPTGARRTDEAAAETPG